MRAAQPPRTQPRLVHARAHPQAWRGHALACVQFVRHPLRDGAAAASLGVWLRRHGHLLTELTIFDHFYTHTGDRDSARLPPVQRMALLQGAQQDQRAPAH